MGPDGKDDDGAEEECVEEEGVPQADRDEAEGFGVWGVGLRVCVWGLGFEVWGFWVRPRIGGLVWTNLQDRIARGIVPCVIDNTRPFAASPV